jgi:hypothetical protein
MQTISGALGLLRLHRAALAPILQIRQVKAREFVSASFAKLLRMN